jgi:oligopeptide/dipeptide ABC transporter ATP-binding protein
MEHAVFEARNLVKTYQRGHGLFRPPTTVQAVRSVSFAIGAGDVLCLVGESGSGKSTIGKMVAGVVPPTAGEIRLDGRNIAEMPLPERNRATLQMQIIHQDPFAALNPTRTIRQSLAAPLEVHRLVKSRGGREERLREVMELVGLPRDQDLLDKYPHQLSGGQRQRVIIARALIVNPRVLVADEATSMVDVSLRVGILRRLRELGDQMGIASLFITHDFGVARYFAHGHQIAVMYLGEFIEVGPTEAVIRNPHHPYTTMLLSAVPLPNPVRSRNRERLLPTSDAIPDATLEFPGCSFANRCPFATERCRTERPTLRPVGDAGHTVSCHHADRVAEAVQGVRTWVH